MKLRDGFLRTKLGGQAYVLPYGQNIADYSGGLRLNETGEILWEGMEAGCSREELAALLKREYGLGDEMAGALEEDVASFQRRLVELGMAWEEEEEEYGWNPLYFSVGPLRIAYKGPQIVYDRYFQRFSGDEDRNVDMTVQIACLPPRRHRNGTVLLRNEEVVLIDGGELYIFLFPGFSALREMQVKKDGSHALLFCDADLMEERSEDIFHAIRFAFLVAASGRGLFLLHSASLLYRGKAWLFSGKSGTGKSTHANLWREAFGVELLNGDLNMLGREGERVMVYGQPWCGTSGICTERSYPLGGIIFLRQASENRCVELERADSVLFIVQRLISPAWERALLERNVAFAEEVAQRIPVWQLLCRPDREAAEVMRQAADDSL